MKNVMTLFLVVLFACSSTEEASQEIAPNEGVGEAEATRPRLVLLVSMDTTRADALDCYSDTDHWGTFVRTEMQKMELPKGQIDVLVKRFPSPVTPRACALASDGIRFKWALSHAPTTLSSHVSMFSGMDPHRHRVVRNGYSIPADVPLVTERFSEAGWDTIAVLASSALESGMGLNRGFRRYVDLGPLPSGGTQLVSAFISADEVTRRALEELDARTDSEQSLFLFVHYYDAHMPWYDASRPQAFAPESLRSQLVDPTYGGSVDGSMASIGFLTRARKSRQLSLEDSLQARALYLSQVAWVDVQLGKLMDGIEARGLMEDALVVVTSDHGEALEDSTHEPYAHGPDVDLSAIHVPLILHGRGAMTLGETPAVVNSQARLLDLPSTLLSMAGLGEVMGDGQDLSGHWKGTGVAAYPHMAEATRPIWLEAKDRWNNLPLSQAVVKDGLMFIKRPQQVDGEVRSSQKLYALAPGQPEVSMTEPGGEPSKLALQKFGSLRSTLKQWNEGAPPYRPAEYDEETEAALRALGYLEASP